LNEPNQLLLTIAEAGEIIRVGRTRMYALVASGAIPAVRIGRSVRIPVDALREWINANVTNGSALPEASRFESRLLSGSGKAAGR